MDKNIKHISNDIRNARLLEENIPKLFNILADYYYSYSGVRLAMHYYAFYEAFCDDEGIWGREAKELLAELNKIIRDNILQSRSGHDREKAVLTVDALRRDIMKRMDALTAFTDIFQIYEYVLNRVEYRFKTEVKEIDEEEFAKEILRYIFDTRDNLIINEKIKEIVGQLPVRITKQKYFELLKESLYAYLGSDMSSFNTSLYMLRTSAMLYHEEGMDALYPGFWEKKEQLAHTDFKDMTKEGYNRALSILQAAALALESETTVYLSLQEIVNEIYAILLCFPYAGMAASEDAAAGEAAFAVIREINGNFLDGRRNELSGALTEKLAKLEGVQESILPWISAMEDVLYEVDRKHKAFVEGLMSDKLMQVLLRTQKLLSDSLFINLEDAGADEETVDEFVLEQEAKALEEELSALFAASDRMVSRAVMANTIDKLPVFFTDHKEVMDYVLYSLQRCSDPYEKAACFEIINEIMSE
jgi:hypothetical protein